ncbi:hypothetical protein MNBD_GAMMA03-1686 [hydrothermal vent metagenome]|uniref:P/Homo B domain-containing protein n=1 Tax=hydrothermal vent metagenome TaxID=652676 RepID=A0A3B0VRX1_9ZZZZ
MKQVSIILILIFVSANAHSISPVAPIDVVENQYLMDVALPITQGTQSNQLLVSGANLRVWDIDLRVALNHPANGELSIRLTSPLGVVSVISTNNGGMFEDVFSNVLFDDQATEYATQYNYVDGVGVATLVPEGAMGAFVLSDPNGLWTLEIEDDTPANDGLLLSWELIINSYNNGQINIFDGSNDTDTPIPNNTQVESEIIMVGILGQQVQMVNVTVVIANQSANELSIELESPAGTRIPLTLNNGGNASGTFEGVFFADPLEIPISDHPFIDGIPVGNVQPEGALSAFMGESMFDTWTLIITDANDPNAQSSRLVIWGLQIVTLGSLPPADVSIEKGVVPIGAPDFTLGGQALYTVAVTNNGPNQAINVNVSDILPAELAYVSDNCGGIFNNPLWEWNIGDLNNGEFVSCDIVVDILATGIIENIAIVSTESEDPDLSNNEDDAVFEVMSVNIPVSIPTSSTISILALLALMLLFGLTSLFKFKEE